MEESATLTAQFDYTVKRFDLDAYTCTVAFALRPKTVQDGLAVSLRLRSLASDDGTTAVELVRDEYDVYRGETVLSMNDDGFEATAAYDTGGERQLETIRDLPGFADEALPKLYEDLSFGYVLSRSYSSSDIRCSVKGLGGRGPPHRKPLPRCLRRRREVRAARLSGGRKERRAKRAPVHGGRRRTLRRTVVDQRHSR